MTDPQTPPVDQPEQPPTKVDVTEVDPQPANEPTTNAADEEDHANTPPQAD